MLTTRPTWNILSESAGSQQSMRLMHYSDLHVIARGLGLDTAAHISLGPVVCSGRFLLCFDVKEKVRLGKDQAKSNRYCQILWYEVRYMHP